MKDFMKESISKFKWEFGRWGGSLNIVDEVVVIDRKDDFSECISCKDGRC
jgi:hypothetical protein